MPLVNQSRELKDSTNLQTVSNQYQWLTGELSADDLPAPTIESLDPDTAVVGGEDLVMTVNGTGFTTVSVIVWNGYDERTDYISDTQVSTIVKPSTLGEAVVKTVEVRNGDSPSNSLDFTFTAPAKASRKHRRKS